MAKPHQRWIAHAFEKGYTTREVIGAFPATNRFTVYANHRRWLKDHAEFLEKEILLIKYRAAKTVKKPML
jgi:hypothetical protein